MSQRTILRMSERMTNRLTAGRGQPLQTGADRSSATDRLRRYETAGE